MYLFRIGVAALATLVAMAHALPKENRVVQRRDTGRLVFAHFIVRILTKEYYIPITHSYTSGWNREQSPKQR